MTAPAAHLAPGDGVAGGKAPAGRPRATQGTARRGRHHRRTARPGHVVGGADGLGKSRQARARRRRRRALGGPQPGQDLGHAGHAAPAAVGRVRPVAGRPEHLSPLPEALLVESIRPDARGPRQVGRGHLRRPRWPPAHPGGAGRRGGRAVRRREPGRQDGRQLGVDHQAGRVPGTALLRAQSGTEHHLRPARPVDRHLVGRRPRGGHHRAAAPVPRHQRPRHQGGDRPLVGDHAGDGHPLPHAPGRRGDRRGRRGHRGVDADRRRGQGGQGGQDQGQAREDREPAPRLRPVRDRLHQGGRQPAARRLPEEGLPAAGLDLAGAPRRRAHGRRVAPRAQGRPRGGDDRAVRRRPAVGAKGAEKEAADLGRFLDADAEVTWA